MTLSMKDIPVLRQAVISDCGLYRPVLARRWDNMKPVCSFFGVNPSKADADIDDPTVRKMFGFASRLGFGGFYVGNLVPYRATDVNDLKTCHDPFGPYEGKVFHHRSLFQPKTLIAAWGPPTKLPKHLRYLEKQFVERVCLTMNRKLYCLGETKDGHPRHPLMTPYDTPLTVWRA